MSTPVSLRRWAVHPNLELARAGGGRRGAQQPGNQIKADVLGVPYQQLARDSSARGARRCRGKAVGIYDDQAAAVVR
jgi:hypothetical protein